MRRVVDIGVFAHNEAEGIAAMVARLLAQDILADAGISARLLILAKGCADDTVALAGTAGAEVVDLPVALSLVAVLDCPGGDGLGLFAIEPALLSGLIAMLTTGRVASDGGSPRRPTRTDALRVDFLLLTVPERTCSLMLPRMPSRSPSPRC